MNDIKNALTRKFGPLPAWAWGTIGLIIYFTYEHYFRNKTVSASTVVPAVTSSTNTSTGSGLNSASGDGAGTSGSGGGGNYGSGSGGGAALGGIGTPPAGIGPITINIPNLGNAKTKSKAITHAITNARFRPRGNATREPGLTRGVRKLQRLTGARQSFREARDLHKARGARQSFLKAHEARKRPVTHATVRVVRQHIRGNFRASHAEPTQRASKRVIRSMPRHKVVHHVRAKPHKRIR